MALLHGAFGDKLNTTFKHWSAMSHSETNAEPHPDWALILALGGPSKVAEQLNLPKKGGPQRVQNWKYRGVPADVKLDHPDLFPHRPPASPPAGASPAAPAEAAAQEGI